VRTVEVSRRADIQWLRALAVTLVVVYHLAPGALPGGYVGVDVFFVISGFLITQGLIRRPPASLRDLGGFWARRIRRLFPASFSVIAATGLTMWLFGPPSQWRMTAQDAVASTAYAQNLNLWHRGVDYLQAGSTPSVYQHFWSLSLEEQFYIFWPILILAVVRLTRNHRPPPQRLLR
jgi:peptidoglycan/LPS O-acetylase OafA/YrhL